MLSANKGKLHPKSVQQVDIYQVVYAKRGDEYLCWLKTRNSEASVEIPASSFPDPLKPHK